MNIKELDSYEILREILFPNDNDNNFIFYLNVILSIILIIMWILFVVTILMFFLILELFEKKSLIKKYIIINGVKDSEITPIIFNNIKNKKPIYLDLYNARIITNARRRINYIEQIFN